MNDMHCCCPVQHAHRKASCYQPRHAYTPIAYTNVTDERCTLHAWKALQLCWSYATSPQQCADACAMCLMPVDRIVYAPEVYTRRR